MKRIIYLILCIVVINKCERDKYDPNDPLKGDIRVFLFPALSALHKAEADICNHLDTLEELLPGQSYTFYDLERGILGKVPYDGKGIQVDLEVLTSERKVYLEITGCLPYGIMYMETSYYGYIGEEKRKVWEIIGGYLSQGWRVATLGFPITIKVWGLTYNSYILSVSVWELNGYGDSKSDFKITIQKL